MPSFCTILIKIWQFQRWLVKNSTKFQGKIFPSHICPKWGSYWQKTCSWCLWNFKFITQANYLMARKKPQNNFFHRGQEHCENGIWNIQIFLVFFIISKYLMFYSQAGVQLVPICFKQNLFCHCSRQFHKIHWEWIELLILRVFQSHASQLACYFLAPIIWLVLLQQ